MKHRGIGPVYSPSADLVACANNYRIFLSHNYSGKLIKQIDVPTLSSGGWTGKALISENSGLAFSPDGQYISYLSQGEADISVSPHLLIFVAINSGQARFLKIPDGYSGYSPLGLITLDFSPDGKYLVFSAIRDGQPANPFIMAVDLAANSFHMVENTSRGISPVWKGR
jgi:WD40 repeat protein